MNKQGPHVISPLKDLWTLKLSKRITIFAWFMLQNKIFTIDNLVRRGCMDVAKYVLPMQAAAKNGTTFILKLLMYTKSQRYCHK
jgi:hypothetical protein